MLFVSVTNYMEITYYAFAALVYGCLLAFLVMSLYYGRRARRNVKREKITELKSGFSPLDIQRIFIGKTYPRRLTRALIVHWANMGYINVKQVGKHRIKIGLKKRPPAHDDESAVFFDRGVYVREHDLFDEFIAKYRYTEVDLYKPLFSKSTIKTVNDTYAVREDEGVYTAKHYTLKLVGLLLSVIPFFLCAVWAAIYTGNAIMVVLVGFALIGLFVLKFVKSMPIPFKIIWCGLWLGASVGGIYSMFAGGVAVFDPLGTIYVAVPLIFVGGFVLIRFLDFRSKNNLDDYSDIVNYRRFLLFAPKSETEKLDYFAALPFLYAFNIKWLTARKFARRNRLPDWYSADGSGKGALL